MVIDGIINNKTYKIISKIESEIFVFFEYPLYNAVKIGILLCLFALISINRKSTIIRKYR